MKIAAKEFKFDFSFIFYDVTTLYFESNDSDELRQCGFSKDNKFNQPQIVLGLLVSNEGFPIGYQIFEGSKMKKFIYIIILIHSISFSQDITEDLLSDNPMKNIQALTIIENKEDNQFTPLLLQIIESKDLTLQLNILNTLNVLNYEDINQEVFAYLNRIENSNEEDLLLSKEVLKVHAIKLLINNGNTDYVNFIYSNLESDKRTVRTGAVSSLVTLYTQYPEFKEESLTYILSLINNEDYDSNIKFLLITYLADDYEYKPAVFEPLFVNLFNNSVEVADVEWIFNTLKKHYSGDLHILLSNRLKYGPHMYSCWRMVDTLLLEYGTPNDLKTAMDHYDGETFTHAKGMIEFSINNFQPPRFPDSDSPLDMLIKIESYIQDLMDLNWVNSNFYLEEIIMLRKESFEGPIFVDPMPRIENILYQLKIDTGSIVTSEGQRFIKDYMLYLTEKIKSKG